jgi:hypothetical protein
MSILINPLLKKNAQFYGIIHALASRSAHSLTFSTSDHFSL